MNIKEIRKSLGLSQNKFARKFHIILQNVKSWEQNVSQPLECVVYMINKILEQEKTIEELKIRSNSCYENMHSFNNMGIKELRDFTGLSQSKFADKFCIPISSIQDWEQGRHKPYGFVLYMIQTILENEEIIKEFGKKL